MTDWQKELDTLERKHGFNEAVYRVMLMWTAQGGYRPYVQGKRPVQGLRKTVKRPGA